LGAGFRDDGEDLDLRFCNVIKHPDVAHSRAVLGGSDHDVSWCDAYVIKLEALAPYPRSDRQIRPDDYVAILTVEAR